MSYMYYIYIFIHTHIYTRIYIHKYTRTHIHTHTQRHIEMIDSCPGAHVANIQYHLLITDFDMFPLRKRPQILRN